MEQVYTPPAVPDSSERIIDPQEVTDMEIRNFANDFISNYEGINLHSEVVTRNAFAKLIFRYDVMNSIEDDGTFHPEDGMKGQIYEIRPKLIIHEQNDGKFAVATRPMSEL